MRERSTPFTVGQAGLDLAESASPRGQGLLGPCCGQLPPAWVRDQVSQAGHMPSLSGQEDPEDRNPAVGSDKPRLHQAVQAVRQSVRPSFLAPYPAAPPSPAPAYSRSSSGAQIVGNGQGQGTPFGKGTPHPPTPTPTPVLPSSAWRLGRKGRSPFA